MICLKGNVIQGKRVTYGKEFGLEGISFISY
jgi:hypothetical protein